MGVALLSVVVAIGVPVLAQTPGQLTPNQVIGIVAAELGARGKTFSNATPQDLQAAAYAATRDNPAQAANVVSALSRVLSPDQLRAVAQGAGNAVTDAVGTGQISAGAGAAITDTLSTVTAPGAGGGRFFFPGGDPTGPRIDPLQPIGSAN